MSGRNEFVPAQPRISDELIALKLNLMQIPWKTLNCEICPFSKGFNVANYPCFDCAYLNNKSNHSGY
jgi:hypothetical protein